MQDVKDKRILTVHWDMCVFCGQCQANCPTEKGIMLSTKFDLATTEKRAELKQEIKKDLCFCDSCGELVAPFDQILWVARRLGPLIFSNASLMLFYLRNLDLALKEKPSSQEETEFLRSDRIKILCPRCRREAVIRS
jgi:hydrogenase-4 component H